MKRSFGRILALAALGTMLVTGCNTAPKAPRSVSETRVNKSPAAAGSFESIVVGDMELYASSSSLELYADKNTGAFAVKTLADGSLVQSCPSNAASLLKVTAVDLTDKSLPAAALYSGSGRTVVERTENGFKAVVTFEEQGVSVPFFVTVEDDHFDVAVAVDEITETETSAVTDLELFAELDAADASENGHFIVPDGSGALIRFNNGKIGATEYSQKIYGQDLAISQDLAPKKIEQAYLPFLGIVREDRALLETVTDGAAYATARASVRGQNGAEYNTAGFEFALRSRDRYFLRDTPFDVCESGIVPEERIAVRYYPIAKKNAGFVDVAKRYRQHLFDEGMMTERELPEPPLFIDLYGGTMTESSFLGVSAEHQTAATTYSQAREILERLTEMGADELVVTYNDFNKAGLTGKISAGADYSGTLGGKSGFKSLADYCATVGITLAPSAELGSFARSGNGYSITGSSVVGVTKAYAVQHKYERAFGTPDKTRSDSYILSPAYFESAYGKVISSFSSEGIAAASFGNGTSILYSDFSENENKRTSRGQAVGILKSCYEMVNNSGLTFVTSACNDYALKYADYIRNVPTHGSGFDIEDEDVPFYEAVIHGFIPYTTTAGNASADIDRHALLSMLTAAPPHYGFMYESPGKFADSDYEELFYTQYEAWLSSAAEDYMLFKENLAQAALSPITDYRRLSETTIECSFENGTVITADLKNNTLDVNGKTLKGATVD